MKRALNDTYKKINGMMSVLFGSSRRVDYKRLSEYVLKINQVDDLCGILNEASRCLKDILGYRMFAFAAFYEKSLNIWSDPEMYRDSVEQIIQRDFQIKSGSTEFDIIHINGDKIQDSQQIPFESNNLLVFDMADSNHTARLYLSPQRDILPYHNEIISIIVKSIGTSISKLMNIKKLKSDVAIDPLTGCYNRREFNSQMDIQFANASRYTKELSVIMFDIDHFKTVNDTYGHQAGDSVLKKLSDLVNQEIRKGDILSRYGGEEFFLILPETSKSDAIELAERLRQKIETTGIKSGSQTIHVTSSFGVAARQDHISWNHLVKEADDMLYKAKDNGRNLVMPSIFRVQKSGKRNEATS